MWGCNAIRNIHAPSNYEAAQRYFNHTAVQRGRAWEPHQKPLYNQRSWHYRIEEHGGGDYYAMCLYHTQVLRFYRPDKDGARRVDVRYHDSIATREFLWRFGYNAPIGMVRGTPRHIIYSPYADATVWHDKDGRFIPERSVMPPAFKKVLTPDDKAKAKGWLEPARDAILLASIAAVTRPEGECEKRDKRIYKAGDKVEYWAPLLRFDGYLTNPNQLDGSQLAYIRSVACAVHDKHLDLMGERLSAKAVAAKVWAMLRKKPTPTGREPIPSFPTADELPTLRRLCW